MHQVWSVACSQFGSTFWLACGPQHCIASSSRARAWQRAVASIAANTTAVLQVLGRSLEALITSAEARQTLWKDAYTSVEHLMLAADDDPHFGRDLLRRHNVTTEAIEAAIKDIRGSNRVSGAPAAAVLFIACLLYTSPSPRDRQKSRMPSSA